MRLRLAVTLALIGLPLGAQNAPVLVTADWLAAHLKDPKVVVIHASQARADYDAGVAAGDFTRAHATVGEATGLIDDVPDAASVIERLHTQALNALSGGR